MRAVTVIVVLLAAVFAAASARATPSPAPAADARFDGSSPAAFADSQSAIESGLGDAARLAFRLQLVEVRNKLAEQRGRALSDAEFAAALDGKTRADLDTIAEAAPVRFTLDIETSDDT
jgi:hypothetical protein